MGGIVPIAISSVLIFFIFWWIKRFKKLTIGEGIFYSVLTLVIVTLIWLKLGG